MAGVTSDLGYGYLRSLYAGNLCYTTTEAQCVHVNDLARIDGRKRDGRGSNPQPVDRKSSALTTTLPSHVNYYYDNRQ